MTQELWDLRKSILDGRYEDALVIVDELELMSRKSSPSSVTFRVF